MNNKIVRYRVIWKCKKTKKKGVGNWHRDFKDRRGKLQSEIVLKEVIFCQRDYDLEYSLEYK